MIFKVSDYYLEEDVFESMHEPGTLEKEGVNLSYMNYYNQERSVAEISPTEEFANLYGTEDDESVV